MRRPALIVGSLLALVVPAASVVVVRAEVRGLWTAERSRWRVEKGGKATLVQLSLRRTGGKGNWNSSFPVPRTELEGLTDAILDAPSGEARFTWRRDAGSFAMEGRFRDGDGAGHFAFTPSTDYRADMKRRGYGEIDDEKALSLALHDVSRAFIDELAGVGYKQVSLDQLTALRIHSVTPDFVKDLKSLGYSSVPVDQLVSMRIHGVSTDFIRRVQGRSGKAVSVNRLVSMRIHGEDRE